MKTEPTDEMKEKKYQWEPSWYADIDYSAEDTDYLREQDCCSGCGAFIGDLPGYYYTESDFCPNCACDRGETWSEELERLTAVCNYGDLTEEAIKEAKEMGL
jgi:predicted amidophosphoribosyltransferase